MEPHSIHIVKVAWTHSASLLAGRAERFPSKLPGPRQRLHITAKPQLISNFAGVLPLILAAVQCQYVLTEKKTQLSREPIPCLKILQLQDGYRILKFPHLEVPSQTSPSHLHGDVL